MKTVGQVGEWVTKLPFELIKKLAQRHGVDPFLIAAICYQESAGRVYAQRFEPAYRWFYKPESIAKTLGCSLDTEIAGQQTSYGLMQVMGAVMREQGFAGWFGEAFAPEVNLEAGIKHLAIFLKRYDTESAIASYNAGAPRYLAGTKEFKNKHYVDGVMEYWNEARLAKMV